MCRARKRDDLYSDAEKRSVDIEDNYVVRIYRRAPASANNGVRDDGPRLIGVVEDPGTGRRRAFHNMEELWALLAETVPAVSRRKRKQDSTET